MAFSLHSTRSLGILLGSDDAENEPFVKCMINQGDRLPASVSATFLTVVDNQAALDVRVMESSDSLPHPDPRYNRELATARLAFPPLPSGSEIKLTLTLRRDGLTSLNCWNQRVLPRHLGK